MNKMVVKRKLGCCQVRMVTILLCLTGLWGMGMAAEGGPFVGNDVQIESIEVLKFEGHQVVRVKSSQALDYSSFPLQDPAGLVLQLPGVSVGELEGVTLIEQALISEIHTTQGADENEHMAEIRIVLNEPVPYRLVSDGDYLFIHLEPQEEAFVAASDGKEQAEASAEDSPVGSDQSTGSAEISEQAEEASVPQINPFVVPHAKRLVDLLVDRREEGTRIAMIGDGDISNYNAFTLEEPRRIVVDIWDVANTFHERKVSVSSEELARVRIGTYPEKVRLVFDLSWDEDGFPPYRLEKGEGKLILCLGEMARDGEPELAAVDALDPVFGSGTEERPGLLQESAQEPVAVKEGEEENLGDDKAQINVALARDDTDRDTSQPARAQETAEQALVDQTEEQQDNGGEKAAADAGSLTAEATAPEVDEAGYGVEPEDRQIAEMVVADDVGGVGADPSSVGYEDTDSQVAESDLEVVTSEGGVTEPRGSFSREIPAQPVMAGQAASTEIQTEDVMSLAQLASAYEEAEDIGFEINTGMTPGEVYMGERINLDFQNIDIENVFRLLAEVSDLNIIVSDKVTGTVTMRVEDIPWDQALDLILSTYKLGSVSQGNVIRVAPLSELRKEEAERRQLVAEKASERQARLEAAKREAQLEREKAHYERDFIEKRIRINYAKASDIQNQIRAFLTDVTIEDLKRVGETIVDERTNTLTVRDYPETIARIEDYISSVDLPTPQVLIETRIVEAVSTFARDLGVQWGANYASPRGSWAYAVGEDIGESAWTQRTGDLQDDFESGVNFPQFLVDLPASAVFGVTPAAAGVQIGRIAGDLLNLDLRLSAAEQEGLTKIISRPKVMTLDNVEAVIAQGREIPYTQVNPEGNVSVVWKEALLRATVTPRISPDKRVHLRLNVTNDDIDPTITSSQGEPAISKQEATTEVLVRNGETVVIGGIFRETLSDSEGGVPGLKDVPVVNWLFKTSSRSDEKRELLIFMTPYIVNMET